MGKGGNEMANYAYFIENIENDYIDNTEIFRLIRDLDVEEDQVYVDAENSKDELEKLLDIIDYDDRLAVRSIADLSDTAAGLLNILSDLQDKGIILESISETLLSERNYYTALKEFIDLTKYCTERSRKKGYQEAKEKGLVGRPAKTDKEVLQAIKMYKSKAFTIQEIEDLTKISKTTLYRYLKDVDRDK